MLVTSEGKIWQIASPSPSKFSEHQMMHSWDLFSESLLPRQHGMQSTSTPMDFETMPTPHHLVFQVGTCYDWFYSRSLYWNTSFSGVLTKPQPKSYVPFFRQYAHNVFDYLWQWSLINLCWNTSRKEGSSFFVCLFVRELCFVWGGIFFVSFFFHGGSEIRGEMRS